MTPANIRYDARSFLHTRRCGVAYRGWRWLRLLVGRAACRIFGHRWRGKVTFWSLDGERTHRMCLRCASGTTFVYEAEQAK